MIEITDALTTAIVVLDPSLRIETMNTSAESLFGRSRERMAGKPYTDLMEASEIDALLEKTQVSFETQSIREVSLSLKRQEPMTADITISASVNHGELEQLLLEIHRVDRYLRASQEEALLSQLSTTQSVISGMAHEIKNPLGGLRGAAQLLETELPTPELKEYTDIIVAEADRLQLLIDRMAGSQKPPVREAVNIHEVLERVRKLVSVGLPDGINIVFDYDPSIPDLQADRDRLIQVVLNIVINAVNALGASGTVTFRTRIRRRFTLNHVTFPLVLALQVVDDGPGIPDDIRDNVFFPMVSGSANGTGLGLSIAQSLANEQGGLIEFQSEPGSTCFTLLMPIEMGHASVTRLENQG